MKGSDNVTSTSPVTLAEWGDRLWGALVDGDEYAAAGTAFAALDAGVDPETVLLEVIAPAQARVGGEWAANRISVAAEHAATAINERVIAALAHHSAGRVEANLGRVAVACVDGEWHALPARLLAEVLRLRGWQPDFLGAHVPTPHLIAHLHQTNSKAVALSSSIPTRLPAAHAAITACQAIGVPVIAGGSAFGPDGRYARRFGADGWAADARGAAEWLRDVAPRPAVAAHHPIDDLPHLADQEYTFVTRNAPALVRRTLDGLDGDARGAGDAHKARGAERAGTTGRNADPEGRDDARQAAAEDISTFVGFLGAALYVDDDALFSQHISWTVEILRARDVPISWLSRALDLLARQLNDFPRARRIVAAARRDVPDRPASSLSNPGSQA
jgi:methanogenic corrinoid protein MtbC1